MKDATLTRDQYPIILISSHSDKQEEYIKKLITEEKISPYYVYRITPVKTELSIEQIRDVRKMIAESTGKIRLFIFEAFDTASSEAQNALLKSLEETTEHNMYILVVKQLEAVISTIQSRSKIIVLDNPAEKTGETDSEIQIFLEEIKVSKDYSFLGNKLIRDLNKTESRIFLEKLLRVIKKDFSSGDEKSYLVSRKLMNLNSLLESNNLNPILTVDNLLIFIYKLYKMKE